MDRSEIIYEERTTLIALLQVCMEYDLRLSYLENLFCTVLFRQEILFMAPSLNYNSFTMQPQQCKLFLDNLCLQALVIF